AAGGVQAAGHDRRARDRVAVGGFAGGVDAQHLAGQRVLIGGRGGVAGVAGGQQQRAAVVLGEGAAVAGGAARDAGEHRLGGVTFGDADHAVVGGGGDVGEQQAVLGVGGGQREA